METPYPSSLASYSSLPLVEAKGQVDANGHWVYQMPIVEVFAINNNQTIANYYTRGNVASISFAQTNGSGNYTADATNFENGLIHTSDAISGAYKVVEMKYETTLVNGDKLTKAADGTAFKFGVAFKNPFQSAPNLATVVLRDLPEGDSGNAAKSVKVIDLQNAAIYEWVNSVAALQLTSVATGPQYRLDSSKVKVTYRLDSTAQNFIGQLAPGSEFSIEGNTTDANPGTITFHNLGGRLQRDYNFTCTATVEFEGIAIVKCEIPVKIQAVQ